MRKLFTLISSALLLAVTNGNSQVFWTENFETGATTGLEVSSYTSANGPWTLAVLGTEGTEPNLWYVSCEEAGQLAGVCGSTCASSMGLGATLHIGSDAGTFGDNGASYDAGGLCAFGFACPATDRRATSPTINCLGKMNIRLKFYYILNGQGTSDDGSVYYSYDDGGTWSLLLTPPKTTTCPSSQGRWDSISVALPSSANNNPQVKIGFRWVNNDDGTGTDPSFAVDSVSLRTVAPSGPAVASMTASAMTICEDSCLTFTNTSTGAVDSFKFSLPGATITSPLASPCNVCFTNMNGSKVVKLYLYSGGAIVDSASTTITVNPAPSPVITKTGTTYSVPALYTSYQWYTVAFPPTAITGATNATYTTTVTGTYAVLVDSGGCKSYAIYVAAGGFEEMNGVSKMFWMTQNNSSSLNLFTSVTPDQDLNVRIFDATGREVMGSTWSKGAPSLKITDVSLPSGMYIIRLSNDNTSSVLKWLKQ